MTTRSEREKAQKQNEQHQAILSKLLREDDNKYCADCQAKGPRWASWNLGVFVCIRCAGVHRNLGVHISRVKSVNLDQWTPEQIQSMVDMGNARARLLYEAHLPDSFQRPQTDQAVEVFIRDKYERKRYYNKEALATAHKSSEATSSSSSPPSQADRSRQEKEHEKKKEEKKKDKESDKVERQNTKASNYQASPMKIAEPAVDLLSLGDTESVFKKWLHSVMEGGGNITRHDGEDGPLIILPGWMNVSEGGGKASGGTAPIQEELDIFGPMVSNPLPSSNNTQQAQPASSPAPPQAEPCTSSASASAATRTEQKKLLSKDSILSLYASGPVGNQSQPQPAAGQGMFMGQPQMPFSTQAFPPGRGGALPASAVTCGEALPNGGFMGLQQQHHQQQQEAPVLADRGQSPYSVQQGQWSMTQMNHQMSGLAVSGGAVPTPTGGWAPPTPASSGQTLSTQLWK